MAYAHFTHRIDPPDPPEGGCMSSETGWSEGSIDCTSGHPILSERPDTPIEERKPCAECGSENRIVSAVVHMAASGTTRGQVLSGAWEVRAADDIAVEVVEAERVEPTTTPADLLDRVAATRVALVHLAGAALEVMEEFGASDEPPTFRIRLRDDDGQILCDLASSDLEDGLLAAIKAASRRVSPRPEDLGGSHERGGPDGPYPESSTQPRPGSSSDHPPSTSRNATSRRM
jgi:hypothetical protein